MRKFAKNTETKDQSGNAFDWSSRNKSLSNIFTGKRHDAGSNTPNPSYADFGISSKAEIGQSKGITGTALTGDDDLIDRLYKLITLKQRLNVLFVEDLKLNSADPLDMINKAYNLAFQDQTVTQADVDDFIQKVKDNKLKATDSIHKIDSKDLTAFFDEYGSEGIIDKLKSEAEDCIRLYELTNLRAKIRKSMDYYNMTTLAHLEFKTVTQKDVDMFTSQKAYRDNFKTMFDQSVSPIIKTKHQAGYDKDVAFFSTYTDQLAKLKKEQAAYDKKGGGNPKEQLNPAVGEEDVNQGINYKFVGGKPGQEDSRNTKFLKDEGLYSNAGYKIYEQDKKDKTEVDMNDVVQGYLGDCYLISSIASVAFENPDYIKDLISYKPGDSFASVTLYIHNKETQALEKKDIKIDFYFPAKATTNTVKSSSIGYQTQESTYTTYNIAFASKGDNELWVMMIEKAYAQEIGSYEAIVNGSPADALAALTGEKADTKSVKGVVKADLKKLLDESIKDNKTAVAGTIKSPTGEKMVPIKDGTKTIDLYFSHAYSIMSVAENTVQLRNPHGGENAVFSISLDDFKAYFDNFHSSTVTRKTAPAEDRTK